MCKCKYKCSCNDTSDIKSLAKPYLSLYTASKLVSETGNKYMFDGSVNYFEKYIDDSGYKWKISMKDCYRLYKTGNNISLKNVINHDVLFSVYPQMRHINVKFGHIRKMNGVEADSNVEIVNSSIHSKIFINLDFDFYEQHGKEKHTLNSRTPEYSKEAVLLHEMQHVCQFYNRKPIGLSHESMVEEVSERRKDLSPDELEYAALVKYKQQIPEQEAMKTVYYWLRSIGLKYADDDEFIDWSYENEKAQRDSRDTHYKNGGLINQKKSNLTPEQHEIVRTPAFKKWFGDWYNDPENASKVVDENGEPLVVYHGTNSDFNIFDESHKSPLSDRGFFFSDNYEVSKQYGKNIIYSFLNIKTPNILNANNKTYNQIKALNDFQVAFRHIGKFGNDGLIIRNIFDHPQGYKKGKKSTIYAVDESTQIKLADGSNTTFDSNNPNIKFNKGGFIPSELVRGKEVEKEHQSTIKKLYEHKITPEQGPEYIAKDHLRELPDYYTRLDKMESFKKDPDEYVDGGQIEKNKETYKKWKSLVNMSKNELQKFYDSPDGKIAGLKESDAKKMGISSGRESARWIIKMKETPVSEWTPTMWKWAKKQISFISRMRGNKGALYDAEGNKTRKHTSLLIWGHNPEKNNYHRIYEDGGLIGNTYTSVKYYINLGGNDWSEQYKGKKYDDYSEVIRDFESIYSGDFDSKHDSSDNYKELIKSQKRYKFIEQIDDGESIDNYIGDDFISDESYWNLIDEEHETIRTEFVEATNKKADEILYEVQHHFGGKYTTIYLDEDHEKTLKLRIADHSGKHKNKGFDDYFLSIVISDKNPTEHFFKSGTEGLSSDEEEIFSSDYSSEEIIKWITGRVEEIKEDLQSGSYRKGGIISEMHNLEKVIVNTGNTKLLEFSVNNYLPIYEIRNVVNNKFGKNWVSFNYKRDNYYNEIEQIKPTTLNSEDMQHAPLTVTLDEFIGSPPATICYTGIVYSYDKGTNAYLSEKYGAHMPGSFVMKVDKLSHNRLVQQGVTNGDYLKMVESNLLSADKAIGVIESAGVEVPMEIADIKKMLDAAANLRSQKELVFSQIENKIADKRRKALNAVGRRKQDMQREIDSMTNSLRFIQKLPDVIYPQQ